MAIIISLKGVLDPRWAYVYLIVNGKVIRYYDNSSYGAHHGKC